MRRPQDRRRAPMARHQVEPGTGRRSRKTLLRDHRPPHRGEPIRAVETQQPSSRQAFHTQGIPSPAPKSLTKPSRREANKRTNQADQPRNRQKPQAPSQPPAAWAPEPRRPRQSPDIKPSRENTQRHWPTSQGEHPLLSGTTLRLRATPEHIISACL